MPTVIFIQNIAF